MSTGQAILAAWARPGSGFARTSLLRRMPRTDSAKAGNLPIEGKRLPKLPTPPRRLLRAAAQGGISRSGHPFSDAPVRPPAPCCAHASQGGTRPASFTQRPRDLAPPRGHNPKRRGARGRHEGSRGRPPASASSCLAVMVDTVACWGSLPQSSKTAMNSATCEGMTHVEVPRGNASARTPGGGRPSPGSPADARSSFPSPGPRGARLGRNGDRFVGVIPEAEAPHLRVVASGTVLAGASSLRGTRFALCPVKKVPRNGQRTASEERAT